MKLKLFFALFIVALTSTFAQTKVGGYVYDVNDEPIPFANVVFKGSTEGTITNEDGRFYLESDEIWNALVVSFVGYEVLEFPLSKKVNFGRDFLFGTLIVTLS